MSNAEKILMGAVGVCVCVLLLSLSALVISGIFKGVC